MEKNTPEYVQEYRQIAIELRAIGAVGEPIFSRGTYQFEVAEKGELGESLPPITEAQYLKI